MSFFIFLLFMGETNSKLSNTIPSGFVPYKSSDLSSASFVEAKRKQEQSVSDFGHDLLLSVNKDKDTTSIFISPLSVSLALSMTASGSNDKTLLEFINVLHLSDTNSSNTILKFQGLLTDGSKKDNSIPLYNVANSIWISNRFEIYKSYVDSVKNAFDSRVEVVDFSSAKLPGQINLWVSDQTKGLIKKIINQIGKDEEMFLINTVYFNRKWAQQFKTSNSKKGDFTLLDGKVIHPMFMHASEKYSYYSDRDVEAAILRFENRQASLLIILPTTRGNDALIQATDKYLTPQQIANILKSAHSQKLNLALPRFNLSFSISLKNSLKTMGLSSAFDHTAKFTYISKDPLKISDVIHQAVLRVDENGVEAAAATVVKMAKLMGMVDHDMPIPFVVNRPFVCAVLDNEMTVFSGIVRDVTASGSGSDL